MKVIREVGRLCLAAIFVIQGIQTAKNPVYPAKRAAELDIPDPEAAARANGTVMALAGSAIALNFWPRVAEFVLALVLVPTTLVGHRFWQESDPQQRNQQKIHFLKNLALFGAMLLLFASKPSRRGR
jgi:putative oxidoreductase